MPKSSRRGGKAAKAAPPPRPRILLRVAVGLGLAAVAVGVYLAFIRSPAGYEYRVEIEATTAAVVVHAAGEPDRDIERFNFDMPGPHRPEAGLPATIRQTGGRVQWEVTLGAGDGPALGAKVLRDGKPVPPSAAEQDRLARANRERTEHMRSAGLCTVRYAHVGDTAALDPASHGRPPTGLKPELKFELLAAPGTRPVADFRVENPPLRGERKQDDGTWVRWDLGAGRYEAAYRGTPVPVAPEYDLALHGDPGDQPRESWVLPRLDTARFIRMRDAPKEALSWSIEIVERESGSVVAVIREGSGYSPLPPDVRKAPGGWSVVVYKDRIVPLETAKVE